MSEFLAGKALRKMIKGIKVERPTALLPQTAAAPIFNIRGGRVAITQIVGEVTTVIQTQLNNTKLTGTPTVGSAADICAVLDISADEVGCLFGITGLNTDALIGIDAGALPGQTRDVILPAGTLDLDCAASNSGSVKWTVFYMPIDDGAFIEAA